MKNKLSNADELSRAIAALELKSAAQKRDIQETYSIVAENLKPANLIKDGVRSVFSGKHNDELLNIVLGLGTGFLGKKLLIGKSRGIVGKTAGMALEWGMAALVSKNAEKIKEKAGYVIDRIFKKHKSGPNHTPASKV